MRIPRGKSCVIAVALLMLIALGSGCGRRMTQSRFRQACLNPAAVGDLEAMLRSDASLARLCDDSGDTPLHEAVVCGNDQAVSVLVRYGASLDARNKILHWTPLFQAAALDRVAAAHRLVDAGADVNLADEFRQTPLHLAVVRRNLEMVKPLVSAGADVNVSMTADGRSTPLSIAKADGAKAIAIFLRQHGAESRAHGLPGQH